MNLPYDAQVLETDVEQLKDGDWFAGIRYRVPGAVEDSYMHRFFKSGPDAEKRARDWLVGKLNPVNRPPDE